MKVLKKLSLLLTMALVLSLSAPSTLPFAGGSYLVDAATVKISKTKATLINGQTLTLKITGTSSSVKWSTSKSSVATISAKGKVTAKKKGTTTITAVAGKKKLTCKITVEAPVINTTSLKVLVGKSYTLKITGTTKSIKWTSKDKSIATVSSKGKVTGKKVGTTKITATISDKKYTCSVTVKSATSTDGTRTNPISAYKAYTTDIYDYWTYLGKFTIQLLDYKDGEEAYDYVMKNASNSEPTASQEYIYVKYKITYLTGENEVKATDIVNHYSGFFNASGNYQLDNIDWGYGFEDVDDMVNVSLYPGGSAICSTAIIVKSGNTPITYRLQTGYDKTKYEPIYTWFTTK